jgi:hypothetical protein
LLFSAQLRHQIQEAQSMGMTSLQSKVIHPAAPYIVRATLVLQEQAYQAHGQHEELLAAENMAMERVFALAGIGDTLLTVPAAETKVTPIRPLALTEPEEKSVDSDSAASTEIFADLSLDPMASEEELTPLSPLDEPGFYPGDEEESGNAELPSALHNQLLEQLMEQTTQEIRRIGMNNNQGRTYLKNSYGKLTRQELTLAELKSFLVYLKSQPSKK